MRMDDLMIKVGLSRSQIYKLIHDDEFPRQLKISPKISVWRESDVDEWMSQMHPSDDQINWLIMSILVDS